MGNGTGSLGATEKHNTTVAKNMTTDLHRPYWRYDGDEDPDDRGKQPNDDYTPGTIAAGHRASGREERAIATLLHEYYAAATNGDGSRGCMLLDPTFADVLAEEPGKPLAGNAKTCAASLSLLFKEQHVRLLVEDVGRMVVTTVRIAGPDAVAILGFQRLPKSEIMLRHDGHAWKVNSSLNTSLP